MRAGPAKAGKRGQEKATEQEWHSAHIVLELATCGKGKLIHRPGG